MKCRDRYTLAAIWLVAILLLGLTVTFASAQCPGGQCGPGGCPTGAQSIRGPFGATATRAWGPGGQTAIATGVFGRTAVSTQGPNPPLVANGWRPAGRAPMPPARVSAAGVCDIIVDEIGSGEGRGQGVLVGNAEVATVAHNIPFEYTSIHVDFGQGPRPATLIAADRTYDIAILRVNGPGAAVRPYLPWVPPQGYSVVLVSRMGSSAGSVTGQARPGDATEDLWIDTSCSSRSGQSGAPFFNSAGNVVGLIAAGDSSGSAGPSGLCIERMKQRIYADQGKPQPPTDPDTLPPRPLVHITREEFDSHSASITKLTLYVNGQTELNQEIQNQLMAHSEAIANLQVRVDTNTQSNADYVTMPQDLIALRERVTALEEVNAGPLFFAETYTNGEFRTREEVIRGGTLEYHSKLVEGAPTDSFHVDSISPGE